MQKNFESFTKSYNCIRTAIVNTCLEKKLSCAGAVYTLYLTILSHRNTTSGKCFPSYKVLQKETGYSNPTLCKYLSILCDIGALKINSGKQGTANTYYFPLESFYTPVDVQRRKHAFSIAWDDNDYMIESVQQVDGTDGLVRYKCINVYDKSIMLIDSAQYEAYMHHPYWFSLCMADGDQNQTWIDEDGNECGYEAMDEKWRDTWFDKTVTW